MCTDRWRELAAQVAPKQFLATTGICVFQISWERIKNFVAASEVLIHTSPTSGARPVSTGAATNDLRHNA